MTVPSNEPVGNRPRPLHIFQERTEEAERRGLSRLATLLKHADPIELFVATATSMMFGLPEELTEAKYGTVSVKTEHLAYELFPHFGRSWTSRGIGQIESTTLYGDDIQACQEALDDLFFSRSFKAFVTSEGESDAIISSIRGRTAIVRGNAYPPQTERRIREVQGRFDDWYARRVGIAPTRAVAALRAIVKDEENTFNEAARPAAAEVASLFEERWHAIRAKSKPERDAEETTFIKQLRTPAAARMAGFASAFGRALFLHVPVLRPRLDPALTDAEWNTLLSRIGLTTEAREKMHEPVEVRNRPLYVLPDGRVLLVDVSNAFDALWEAFDAAARQDQNFYNTRYQKHAATWLEERVAGHLRRLFPDGDIYKTLDYPDPVQERGATAELDVTVVWGPFLLLIEAKAKQFRLAGQLGDVGRLRTDLKRNVEEAFDQALRARQYIETAELPVFKERETNRQLALNKARFRRVYLLTVSLHGFATLTTRLAALEPLGLFKRNEYPFAISEGDLEILAELCPGPEVFLHYIEKRIALHRVSPEVSADEVDLLGAYLDTRFVSGQLWDNPDSGMAGFSLDGYSDEIDRWARHRWAGIGEPLEIQLAVPEAIRAVLARLRVQPEDDARWIAFCLLELPLPALEALAYGLELARQQPPKHGTFRRFVWPGDDVVICVVSSNGHSPEQLTANLEQRVAIERYRRRTRKAVGFGIATEDTNPFTVAIWADMAWEPNPTLHQLVENDAFGIPLAGTKMPGRNAPCLCGSGKKFKKCCLPKIEKARRGQGQS
jgi:hypothetical protein